MVDPCYMISKVDPWRQDLPALHTVNAKLSLRTSKDTAPAGDHSRRKKGCLAHYPFESEFFEHLFFVCIMEFFFRYGPYWDV
jgi:hypothetical protein